jgi:hypothetical protein
VRVLGADHPGTLGSRNNLACAYQDAGDLGRAIPLWEQTLADSVRVLGPGHPQTKIVRQPRCSATASRAEAAAIAHREGLTGPASLAAQPSSR